MKSLQPGYLVVAHKLQEAAELSAGDTITRLRDAIQDQFRGTGSWAYYVDHFGDDKTGQVIYSNCDDIRRAVYTITSTAGAAKCVIDFTKSENVVPRTVYELETDAVAEAKRAAGGDGKLRLVESVATCEAIVLREAKADYKIKLIAPGEGSSAIYPAEVLKRDGPKVFKAGTHVYLNHPTLAEESARPERDVANLAGVLTTTAVYETDNAKGEGLYAQMKVFADHATIVEEKAPHVGMSIRASGLAESGKKQNGKPILKELTYAESVDVVTRAGAGGLILTEAAPDALPIPTQEAATSMTADEAKKLIETANLPFRMRLLRSDAKEEATRILESATLPAKAKLRIIERALSDIPTIEATGEVDLTKVREAVVREAKVEAEYLSEITGGGRVFGLGESAPAGGTAAAPAVTDPAKLKEAADQELVNLTESFVAMGMSPEAAALSAKRGMAA